MAKVDVTELLVDPDFIDALSIVHRTPTINDFGENELVEKCIATVGSVQPISGRALQRLPEALRIHDVSTFWVKGVIVSSGECKYPDLLVFKTKRYQVQTVLDWTNFGAGWCEGLCIAERVS